MKPIDCHGVDLRESYNENGSLKIEGAKERKNMPGGR
jgi:hypothetical protein